MTPQESTFGSGWDSKSAEEHSFSFPEGQFSLWKRANAVSNCEACVHTGATQAEWTRLLLCTGGKTRLRLLAEQTTQQGDQSDADEGAAASHELFHPQLGVKTLLDGGRRRTKNLYGVVKRTVPAGQVRQ